MLFQSPQLPSAKNWASSIQAFNRGVLLAISSALLVTIGSCGKGHDAVSGYDANGELAKSTFLVSSADPRASQAGIDVLEAGGDAIDAAVAVQTVLSLVEPQSSGVGGGAFMLYYDNESGILRTFDGRERAPASATPEMFLDANGQPLPPRQAWFGGRGVGVPGVMALLGDVHREYGALPWEDLFDSPIGYATDGFEVSPRLASLLERMSIFDVDLNTTAYFSDESGSRLQAGAVLKNPDYAATLRSVAEGGAEVFYSGHVANEIAAAVSGAATSPRVMTIEDLDTYRVVERLPLCGAYHQYKICGMGPPTSGTVFILQSLAMLEPFNLSQFEAFSPPALHLILEAGKVAFADRQKYLADPDFVEVPIKGLLHPDYIAERRGLIDPDGVNENVAAGTPEEFEHQRGTHLQRAPGDGPEIPSTSHFSIIDGDGNVISMTTTVQGPFGSQLMVGGFLLNNELTDFSFSPVIDGKPVANAVAPYKRPRSSMSPVIVFDENDDVVLALGSAGGSKIFGYVLKSIIAVLDWKMSMQASIDAPNVLYRGRGAELEAGGFDAATVSALENLGHAVVLSDFGISPSGNNGFLIGQDGKIDGGADKRRGGRALLGYSAADE